MAESRYLSPRQQRRGVIRQAIAGIVMLPLSMLPFVAYFSTTQQGALVWARVRSTVAPVRMAELDELDQRWIEAHRPSYAGSVAILVYHGLGTSTAGEGGFTISPEDFAEQIAFLEAAGMHAVTARDLAAARRGEKPLPENAVMITFDDGRIDAMLYADPVLADAGMAATMFVIADAASRPGIYYASWGELRGYARSGRWDLESHTSSSHHLQPTDDGRELPALTSLAKGETFERWAARVEADIDRSITEIERNTGQRPVAFAYPFGSWGTDDRVNDPRIGDSLRSLLARRFSVGFVQDDQATWTLSSCGDDALALRRLEVGPWSGRELLSQLTLAATTAVDPGPCTGS
jgi:peptidoglycan/xylan/chitin deacetylase (PgdA/CDA1 family)